MRTTRIAGNEVTIDDGPTTTITFLKGRGTGEDGLWEFWTVDGPSGPATSRCRPERDPGQRFREALDRPEDAKAWEQVRRGIRMYPATCDDVAGWLNKPEHASDVPGNGPHQVMGRNAQIEGQHGTYRVTYST